MIIQQFRANKDNYGTLLHDPDSNMTIAIDAPCFESIESYASRNQWKLNAILLTHCHEDHVQAIPKLWSKYSFCIYGSYLEENAIRFVHKPVQNHDSLFIGNNQIIVLETPGHTRGSISYYLPSQKAIFVGDTLFSLGCGRVEGTAYNAMFYSLNKLRKLADDTKIYCGHDYAEMNCKFALAIEPHNPLLLAKKEQIKNYQINNQILPPSTIAEERALNPFLRWDDKALRKKLYLEKASDLQVFTTLRKMRDCFKG